MSSLEEGIVGAQARFHLLQRIHPFFEACLPTVDQAKSGLYGDFSEDLCDEITLLRTDIRCMPIKLQRVNIDHIEDDADAGRLIKALDCLLVLFEDSVHHSGETEASIPTSEHASRVAQFPKLIALWDLKRQNDKKGSEQGSHSTDESEMLIDEQATTKLASFVQFPPPQKSISSCLHAIDDLVDTIADIFPSAEGRWSIESQLAEITDIELDIIKEAYAFSKSSTSLFRLLVDCITCKATHIASLHLSGFRTQQWEMLLGTGEHDWISACFSTSTTPVSTGQKFKSKMCAHLAAMKYHDQTIVGCFNETAVWEDGVVDHSLYDHTTTKPSLNTLDGFIQGLGTRAKDCPKVEFESLERKQVGVYLALSLFQLCGSPWLQHTFEGDKIYILPKKSPVRPLDYWRPHISCRLDHYISRTSLSEDVAALGVLILELEAKTLAGWKDDDEDYTTGTKSNKFRLYRILHEWKRKLAHSYLNVGWACMLFEIFAETLDDEKIGRTDQSDENLRDMVILYKCILNPLYRKLVTDFPGAERQFRGVSGLSVPITRKRVDSAVRQLVLYDDEESTEGDISSTYAENFMTRMEDGFLSRISALRPNCPPIDLAETMRGIGTPEKIRIAVLDTGIDPTDKKINGARERIVKKRSWVGSSDDWTDKHGHGTHVVRVLLTMAPAADIYVAKITEGKCVEPQNMSGIAQAIDWAVNEWNVDIISMSFGFEDQNQDISTAIGRAFKADKLLFAAASNDGGNKRRSRPARSDQVICIHACDGKGNKGRMSPSPEENNLNLTALGVAVRSRWKKKTVYKSGTSFATPMAAGIAASVLEFANFKCKLSEEDKANLYKREGLLKVFRAMSTKRDGYDYLNPGHIWDSKSDEIVVKRIQGILEEI